MLATLLSSFVVPFLVGFAKDALASWLSDRNAKELGAARVKLDTAEGALASVAQARRVEVEASVAQAADRTDAAFDQDFKRR